MRFLLMFLWLAAAQAAGANGMQQAQTQKPGSAPATQGVDPQQLFQRGEAALKSGNLDEAEHAFRGVLAINPQVAGAYANLGVILHAPQAVAAGIGDVAQG